MKIANVRAGFATNSSSSHSIIMMQPGFRARTDEKDRFTYGWEEFTLADKESKNAYFATQLFFSLCARAIPEETAVDTINSLLNTDYSLEDLSSSYVDHQSVWGMNAENLPLIKALYEFAMRDDVVFLGGNDNSDPQEYPKGGYYNQTIDSAFKNLWHFVRNDGDYWILFNKQNGMKIRFSVSVDSPDYVKSGIPELVDLKLTDSCPYKCAFCYQGSLPNGKHADTEWTKQALKDLADIGVFEVAIGGGEPTQHPDFAEIIEYADNLGLCVNFTCYGTNWCNNPKIVKAVSKHVKAIGVSVHTADQLKKLVKIKDSFKKRAVFPNLVAQHVVGTQDLNTTAELIEACWQQGVNILLLGYKNTGFGANCKQHDMSGLDIILKLRWEQRQQPHYNTRFSMLGVDTAFIEQFKPILDNLKIPSVLMTSEEGKFSCYIDAVEQALGPSSYMPNNMVTASGPISDVLLPHYRTW